jgi:predicted restriction endonuclease
MRKLKLKTIICKFCNKPFEAKRIDAKRCLSCKKKRSWQYEKQPHRKKVKIARYALLRKSIIEGYGGKCNCCGETQLEFLAIDHVNGGGRKERKTKSIHQIMVDIVRRNFPDDYRVLCHNCNQSLGWYGYCPHKKRTA